MSSGLKGEQLISKAAEIAEKWHDGQVHSFGDDTYYNMHLKPVADIVTRLGYGAMYVAGAYLHDSKEDTTITDEDLLGEGIPTEVVHAVNLLAKKDGEHHEDYLRGIITSAIATVDKYADSSFNFSWTTLNSPNGDDTKFASRHLEYAHNIAVLRPHLPETS
ncbi:MAG: hypothetical protein ABI354_03480 [Candidatus Saccharimonadales bacterium]